MRAVIRVCLANDPAPIAITARVRDLEDRLGPSNSWSSMQRYGEHEELITELGEGDGRMLGLTARGTTEAERTLNLSEREKRILRNTHI